MYVIYNKANGCYNSEDDPLLAICREFLKIKDSPTRIASNSYLHSITAGNSQQGTISLLMKNLNLNFSIRFVNNQLANKLR